MSLTWPQENTESLNKQLIFS